MTTAAAPPVLLTTLPVELQLAITSHLSYPSLQSLKCVSRHLHQLIAPAALSSAKFACKKILAQYEYYGPHILNPNLDMSNSLRCYECLRMKPSTAYKYRGNVMDIKQGSSLAIRRRCQDCDEILEHHGGECQDLVMCWYCEEFGICSPEEDDTCVECVRRYKWK